MRSKARNWNLDSRSQKLNFLGLLAISLLSLFVSCSGEKSEGAKTQERLSNTEIKYFTNGKKLYTQYCSNCHAENGEGLGRLIPPLKNSDYLLSDIPRAAQIILNGQKGPIIVNGVEYNQPMPANPKLNDTQVLEILTYITNSWGNEHGGIDPELIKK